jgi:hypothetical protein
MAWIPVTLSECEGKRFRLQALAVFTDTATCYSAEFSDSLSGAVGLARFMAMLRMLTGLPVALTVKAEVQDEAMKKVIEGGHPPVRYDKLYRVELHGEAAADERKDA